MRAKTAAAAVLVIVATGWPLPARAEIGAGLGPCVTACLQDLGATMNQLCELACRGAMAGGTCTYQADGCCSPFLSFADPDCGVGGVDLAALQQRVADLEATVARQAAVIEAAAVLLEHLRLERGDMNGLRGPHLVVEGANLHVRSGSGSSEDWRVPTGLGNLIVGYNESPREGVSDPAARRGSHNIVSGPGHAFPSFGGVVTGEGNTIEGQYSLVLGGWQNRAREWAGVAVGGSSNETDSGVVMGGIGNRAYAQSVVLGGLTNVASGSRAVITGGAENVASGQFSTVSGGFRNSAQGTCSVAGGGAGWAVSEDYGWKAGEHPDVPEP